MILPRKSVSGSHVGPRGDVPNEIKVLEKKRPASLSSGEFARVLEVRQIFMIGEDGDGMRSPLQVLFPLNKGEDNGEELSIIYVVVALGRGEGL